MHMKVTLLGYGEMGHAMEAMLTPGHDLQIWDPYYQGTLAEIDLDKAVQNSDAVIFCTPTSPIFELAEKISPNLQQTTVCLSMGKGLDGEGRTAAEALDQGLSNGSAYAVLYGPMIAEEILKDRPAFATVAGSDSNALTVAKALFAGTVLKLQTFDDVKGAAWCAVLKNVYAMLLGVADELQMGANVRGYLMVACLQEMAKIMSSMGGRTDTPYTLAGLGDLVTTGTSEDSHHHGLGRQVIHDGVADLQGEGINTLDVLARTGSIPMENYRIMHIVWRIMRKGEKAQDLIPELLIDL